MAAPLDKTTTKTSRGGSRWILWGLLLGLACGITFGDYCRPLMLVGEAYVKLLQMTVMPYILASLILGIGSLTAAQAKELARKAGGLLLLFWAIALAAVILLPLSFPHWQSAAFFSTSLVEQPEKQNPLDLYIPSNPIRSLADNIVPAVVLFSILVGIALMGIKEKAPVLRGLATASEALSRVTGFVVNLTPIGLFAIVAAASGSMSVQDFGRLQVFLVAYIVAALFLAFWVLPGMVSLATPFTYRESCLLARDALITAFVTGNLLVVLPVLNSRARELFRARNLQRDATDSYVDVIVPVSFNFPTVGKLLLLVFLFFAAWFSGSAVSGAHYPKLLAAGLLSFFGSTNVAVPYLLDMLRLPRDLFQLYLISGLLTGRFAALLSAMNLFVFTILAVSLLTGVAAVRRARLVSYVVATFVLTLALLAGLRLYFGACVKNTYTMAQVVGRMHLLSEPVQAKIYPSPPTPPPHTPGKSRLQEIRDRGYVRVGYLKDRLPYAFTNEQGQLVGFDIEMAHDLARLLKTELEFVPIDRERVADQVNAGLCDLLLSGIALTPDRAAEMNLSAPYREETLALIVPGFRRKEFTSRAELRARSGLRVAVLSNQYYTTKFRNALPQVEWLEVSSPREFFEDTAQRFDALLFTAEAGSAWTLMYPRFAVVVPQPGLLSIPLVYAVARGDQEMADYVNAWIELKRDDGTMQRLYDYWILGRGAAERQPRWSLIRNVLHWSK
ncbi:MAG TPA: cation:dicarboxylase symporter family transporter [Candidatus Acidoferrum sp.]|nr:cation:dicarboxylase symporter family transporter [Candidatus Acidoferrum sp.]